MGNRVDAALKLEAIGAMIAAQLAEGIEKWWRKRRVPLARPVATALVRLGLPPGATLRDVERAFRRLALQNHADVGGSDERMRDLLELRRRARAEVAARRG